MEDLTAAKRNTSSMRIQAVLVIENNLGPECSVEPRYHPTVHRLLWDRGASYLVENKYHVHFNYWNYCLQLMIENQEPLEKDTVWSFERMTTILGSEKKKDGFRLETKVTFEKTCAVFKKAVRELERAQEMISDRTLPHLPEEDELLRGKFNDLVVFTVLLLSMSCQLLDTAAAHDEETFRNCVIKLIQLDPRGPMDQTIFQLVSSDVTNMLIKERMLFNFPCINSISLLTDLGVEC